MIPQKVVRIVLAHAPMLLAHEREKKARAPDLPILEQECKGCLRAVYARSQTEKSGKGCRDSEELDGDLASSWSERIASQPFFPRASAVSPLRTREQKRVRFWLNLEGLFQMHVDSLTAQQLDAGPSMLSPAPVTPEERSRADFERVEQHTHLARLFGGAALPLTLLAQGTGAAAADAGCIHHAQASIGFAASLVCYKRLASWTTERPIRLERKVLTREAILFPGQAHLRGSIVRGRSRVRWGRRNGRSKRETVRTGSGES